MARTESVSSAVVRVGVSNIAENVYDNVHVDEVNPLNVVNNIEQRITTAGDSTEERINIRIAASQKSVIEYAAALTGLSITDYVRSTMLERARADIKRIRDITLSESDVEKMTSASTREAKPNARLREASERYLKMVSDRS